MMNVGICVHFAGLSLLDTILFFALLVVGYCRLTVHNWVHQVDLYPADGAMTERFRGDKTVIMLKDER